VVHRAYRCRVYPTAEQEPILRQTFGCVRWVWNRFVSEQRMRDERGEPLLSYYEASPRLTVLKHCPEYQWLNAVPSVPLQQTLRHLARAQQNWRAGRAHRPVYKRLRGKHEAAEFTRGAFRWDPLRRALTLSKIGLLRVRWSRPVPHGCEPSTVTLTRDSAGRTFISVLVNEPIAPFPPTQQMTAVDLGLTTLVTAADGAKVTNPRHFARRARQLAHAQRVCSRKRASSRNRDKALLRVARLHARIADARRDALHKLTTRIVSENQAIACETLRVRGMRRHPQLGKAIGDAAWSELIRQLQYKADWYGRQIVRASPWFPSSKRCSACGEVRGQLALHVRNWTCVCGAHHERDVNAAKNLLSLLVGELKTNPTVGHTVVACGG